MTDSEHYITLPLGSDVVVAARAEQLSAELSVKNHINNIC